MSSAHEDAPNAGPAHPAAPAAAEPNTAEPTPAPPAGGPRGPVLRSSRLKLGIVAAVSAVIVIGGGVAVAQAASGANPVQDGRGPGGHGGGYGAPGGGPSGNGQGGPGGHGFQGNGGFGRGGKGALGGMLHGDFVIKKSNGQYVTQRLQTGTVTAVSATSITAKSEDGHATTFVVGESTRVGNGSATISDVKTGDTVTIVGVVSGDTATATRITDLALRQPDRGDGGSDKRPGGSPRPSRTA
ncbi:hypothetical protein [Dactylosporangium sp. NPDC051484]|uniref:hypothetical protein n=1 Tax=Dactylosporangium sp. NPDC051484 TaxID=3154942 RepID=UPI0034507C92